MIIKRITQLTAGTAMALALVAGGVQADTMMSDEELVTKIEEELAANPETAGTTVDVVNEDGMIRVEGLAEQEAYDEIVRIIGDMEGTENVENAIVVQ